MNETRRYFFEDKEKEREEKNFIKDINIWLWLQKVYKLLIFLSRIIVNFSFNLLYSFLLYYFVYKMLAQMDSFVGDAGVFVFPIEKERDEKWIEKIPLKKEIKEEFIVWRDSIFSQEKIFDFEIEKNKDDLLLFGLPGTGKTFIAEMFSKNESLAYSYISFGTELFHGSAKIKQQKKIEEAIKILEKYANRNKKKRPIVLIVDEIDSLGGNKASIKSDNQALDSLLILIDKIKRERWNIIFIATTNNYSFLENSLIRRGRFGFKIEFSGEQTNDEIKEIINYLRNKIDVRQQVSSFFYDDEFWEKIESIIIEEKRNSYFTFLDISRSISYSYIVAKRENDNDKREKMISIFSERIEKMKNKIPVFNNFSI